MADKMPKDTVRATKKKAQKGNGSSLGRIYLPSQENTCPLALSTRELLYTARAFPPPDRGRDRTQGDRERFKDRMRGKLDKNKLKDIIKNNPVFGDKGKIRVPVDGGKEPRWRPGRDGKGGPGRGRKGSADPGDLVYIDMDYEEFIEWLFEDLELPFLQKTDQANILVPVYRIRGFTDSGPEQRIDWDESEIKRIERGIAMLHSSPEDFPVLNETVIDALIAAIAKLKPTISADATVNALTLASETLVSFKEKKPVLPVSDEAVRALQLACGCLLDTCAKLTASDPFVESVQRLQVAVAALRKNPAVLPTLDPENDIPTQGDAPFIDDDFIYNRVEISYEPDSKAVVFLVLDRSGSMGGDPLAIAKFYFLLNILFLRTRYKDVEVVMIAHDAQAYEIEDEKQFYQIEVDGGTMFVPAYEKVLEIMKERYPVSSWNRYMFQATDGYMFDPDDEVTYWWHRLISKDADGGTMRFGGYLEIDPWAGRFMWGGQRSWAPGGEALLNLNEDDMKHVGMARVSNMDEVIQAFTQILTKDMEV